MLSVDEVTRLLQSAGCLKYKAALGVAYGAGLRASEVCHLTTTDIDSKRMVLRVEQGKGNKDRSAFHHAKATRIAPLFTIGMICSLIKHV